MTPYLPLCENCSKPAVYVWTNYGIDSVTCAYCRPGDDPASVCRPAGEADLPTVIEPPLTPAQAATREGVDVRTIYRHLHAGDYGEGAWKAHGGSRWFIDPTALDSRRVVQRRPGRTPTPKVRQADMTGKATTSDHMGWPT